MQTIYTKDNPFFALIKERTLLNKEGSEKRTYHLVLDIRGSSISYAVGDSIAILPTNAPEAIARTLAALKATGKEEVIDKKSGSSLLLYDYLVKKANLSSITKGLFKAVAKRHPPLQHLLEPEQKALLDEYLDLRHVYELLEEYPEVRFSPQEFCALLMPLLPRFYSIASSMKHVGEEVHLTIAQVLYKQSSSERYGLCTDYLCRRIPLHESVVPVYIQPSHGFTLPTDPTIQLIMVGPGTGVAPFRAFMQERTATQAPGDHWLFFGEQRQTCDFLYEEEWKQFSQKSKLRLDTAFSRDQADKVYVQHRLIEKGEEIWEWLQRGAHFYVCGDASQMAKDVDAALHHIAKHHGNLDEQAAKAFIKQLRADKRYLRDIY